MDPYLFRLTNLGLHVLSALLLCHLLQRTVLLRPGAAFVVAALFAVHPLAVTPLMWVSDRTDLVALVSVLAFYAILERYTRTRARVLLVALGVVMLVGLAAKQTGAASVLVTLALVARGDARTRAPLAHGLGVQILVIERAPTGASKYVLSRAAGSRQEYTCFSWAVTV
jgi:hypothetical protein